VPATVIFTLASLLNPNDPIEMAEAERLNERVVHRALSLKGPHRRARYRLRQDGLFDCRTRRCY
jgi:hypothetical protein